MIASNKILLITSEFPPNVGGIGNHAYNLAKALSAEGFIITVIADIIGINEFERNAFAGNQPFHIKWIERKSFILQTYLRRIYTSLDLAGDVSKVICSGKFSLWTGAMIKIFYPNKKLIAVVHGSELTIKSSLARRATSYALKKFRSIISVSNYTRRFLPAGLPLAITIKVIHNGIDFNEFCKQPHRLLEGDPALITIGSLTERKGQENVINALPKIMKFFPSVQYHMIGKPVIQQRIESIAKQLNVQHHISFYGSVDRENLLKKIMGATIKLMLSNHTADGDFEGFGIAVLEANAFGIPAIGSRDSGIAEAIQHEKTGLLVDPKNAIEVAAAIEKIMTNYDSFSANAKEWARQHDWKIIVKEYIHTLSL